MKRWRMNIEMRTRNVFFVLTICSTIAIGAIDHTSAVRQASHMNSGDVKVVDGREYPAAAKECGNGIAHPISSAEAPAVPSKIEHTGARELGNPGGRLHVGKNLIDEERDEAWGGATEAAIKEQVSAIPYTDPATFEVDCRSTTCRATGWARDDTSPTDRKSMIGYVEDPEFGNVDPGFNAIVAHASWHREGSKLAFAIDYARIRK